MKYTFDLECLPNYYLATLYCMDTKEYWEGQVWKNPDNPVDRGKASLERFHKKLLSLKKDDWVLTYNGISYDLPLYKSWVEEGFPSTERAYEMSQEIINSEEFSTRVYKYLSFTHIDVMELLNLKGVTMKKAAAILGFKELLDMPKEHYEEVMPGEPKLMKAYCRTDCRATAFIGEKSLGEIETRIVLEEMYPELDLKTLGRPRAATKTMVHLYKKKYGENPYSLKKKKWGQDMDDFYKKMTRFKYVFKDLIPDVYRFSYEIDKFYREVRGFKRKGWYGTGKETTKHVFNRQVEFYGQKYTFAEGGLHDDGGAGIWETKGDYIVAYADAGSFYPMLQEAFGFNPKHLPGYGLLRKQIVKTRFHHKALRFESKKSDDIQNAFKIKINALFGQMGSYYSPFFCPESRMSVTLNGQLALLQLIDWLCGRIGGIEIIHANTDGVGLYFHKGKLEKVKAACEHWVKCFKIPMDLDILGKFVKKNTNSYLIVRPDGSIEKGAKEFNTKVDAGKSRQDFIIAKALRAYFVDGISPGEFVSSSDDIQDFLTVASCPRSAQNYFRIDGCEWGKLQRTFRHYKAIRGGEIGVMYANGKNINQHPLASSSRVLLTIEREKASDYPDLDRNWYIQKIWEEIKSITGSSIM